LEPRFYSNGALRRRQNPIARHLGTNSYLCRIGHLKRPSLTLYHPDITYLVFLAMYQVALHPPAKYSGPFLWRVPPFPSIISLLRGRISFDYKVLHDRYGPGVHVMPNELSFNAARA
jgi:hypothetical protein